MASHEEYMSERYSKWQLEEIRDEMKKSLEEIYEREGNVKIEVSYREFDYDRSIVRRDTMWTFRELLDSFDGEHDLIYFSDLEAPTEQYPFWSIAYDLAWQEENIKFS